MRQNQQHYQLQGETFMSDLVQQRIGHTMAYFGYGLSITGATTYLLRNSRIAQSTGCGIAAFVGGLGLIVGMHMTDYQTNSILKSGLFAAFCGIEALMILPLIQMSTVATIG